MSEEIYTYDGVTINEEDLVNGYSAETIFSGRNKQGLTFDDVISLPGMIDFGVHDVELNSNVTRNIKLNIPFCSSPMDTVTEEAMAIGMALNGGIGFIHCACDIEEQVEMVRKVKTFENGFIVEPAVLSPHHLVSDLDKLQADKDISGVPVTIDGKMGSKLLGLVSNRDTDFIENRNLMLSEVMTPIDDLYVGRYPLSITEANEILKECKKGYLPIVDDLGNLRSLTTRTDLKKNRDFPLSSKNSQGKLLVGAAVRADAYEELEYYRIDALVEAGCDIILLDSSNGDNDIQIEAIKYMKRVYPQVDVIAGNVCRLQQAKTLLDAGADALRVGMGVGSVSTTQLVTAVGRAQVSAIYSCGKIAREYNVPIIADGGVKNTGCLIKALMLGASCVMMGSLLAGVDESPGDYYLQDGIRLKSFRGMLSRDSMLSKSSSRGAPLTPRGLSSPRIASLATSPRRSRSSSFSNSFDSPNGPGGIGCISNTIFKVPSGVSGSVVDKGPLNRYVPYLIQSVRHGLQDLGTVSLDIMWKQLYSGELRFELRSASAQREGGVHDLHSFSQTLYAM